MGEMGRFRRAALLLLTLAVALVAALCLGGFAGGQKAYAVVNLGSVGVHMPSSVSVESGSTGTVSALCDPAYSDQYPNCMNDYCPSGCDFGTSGEGIACENPANGQCTCYGYTFSRYYPSCAVSSSDPSVARASWADGVLSIAGYRAGSCTVTVTPSLRLFSSAPSSITVTVTGGASSQPSEPAAPSGGSSGSSSSSGQATSSSGGSSGSSGSGSGSSSKGSGSVSVSPTSKEVVEVVHGATAAAAAVAEAEGADQGDGAADEVIEEAAVEDTYHIGDAGVDVAAILAQSAGQDKVISFWGGTDPEAPLYIWEVPCHALSADALAGFDLTLFDITADAANAVHEGEEYSAFKTYFEERFPGKVQLFWRTGESIDNDAVVDVYRVAGVGEFEKVHSNLRTAEGYVCFNLIEGGEYLITTDSTLADAQPAAASIADDEDPAAGLPDEPQGLPWFAYAALGVVVAAVVAVAAVTATRKKKGDVHEQDK